MIIACGSSRPEQEIQKVVPPEPKKKKVSPPPPKEENNLFAFEVVWPCSRDGVYKVDLSKKTISGTQTDWVRNSGGHGLSCAPYSYKKVRKVLTATAIPSQLFEGLKSRIEAISYQKHEKDSNGSSCYQSNAGPYTWSPIEVTLNGDTEPYSTQSGACLEAIVLNEGELLTSLKSAFEAVNNSTTCYDTSNQPISCP